MRTKNMDMSRSMKCHGATVMVCYISSCMLCVLLTLWLTKRSNDNICSNGSVLQQTDPNNADTILSAVLQRAVACDGCSSIDPKPEMPPANAYEIKLNRTIYHKGETVHLCMLRLNPRTFVSCSKRISLLTSLLSALVDEIIKSKGCKVSKMRIEYGTGAKELLITKCVTGAAYFHS